MAYKDNDPNLLPWLYDYFRRITNSYNTLYTTNSTYANSVKIIRELLDTNQDLLP